MTDKTASENDTRFSELIDLMARLRSPEGCPWDRQQDHRSLRPCLLEEAHEVLEAIDRGDLPALREELGDLLLQVIFHAQLASEEGRFTIADVIRGLHDKLVARHPHVFGAASAETPAEVLEQWDHLKRKERGPAGEAIVAPPPSLPALSRAQVVLRRAARVTKGPSADDASTLAEAALAALRDADRAEAAAEAAVGEILLAVVQLAGALGVDAEQALRERVNRHLAEVQETTPTPASGADTTPEGTEPG
jgi:tetrapyrrole methylase family protein/MazG family protein